MPDNIKENLTTIIQVGALVFAFALVFFRSEENKRRSLATMDKMSNVQIAVSAIDAKVNILLGDREH